jgi:uncharacterized membrane protein
MLKRFCWCAALVLQSCSWAFAQIPFQPLPDFGFGGTAAEVGPNGAIVGSAVTDASFFLEPVVWESVTSEPIVLPTDGLGGYAVAINNSGVVVGTKFLPVGSGGTPVVWIEGVATDLPTLGEGGNALDINDAGQIVGFVNSNEEQLPALWQNGQLRLLTIPSFGQPSDILYGYASSINNAGDITGTLRVAFGSDSIALRWSGDTQAVSTLGPNTWLETRAVNSNNVGNVLINGYFDPNGTFELALLRGQSQIERLSSPVPFMPVWGTALNENDLAVGYYGDFSTGRYFLKALAWQAGRRIDLELPEGFAWALPSGVGEDGSVVGYISDGVSGVSIPGFWKVPPTNVAPTMIVPAPAEAPAGSTATISGRLMNRQTQRPVANQVVRMRSGGADFVARTDQNGRYTLRMPVPRGMRRNSTMRVDVSFPGTSRLQRSVGTTALRVR